MTDQSQHDAVTTVLLSIAGVCAALGIGRSTFYKLASSGEIKTCKVSGLTKVHRDDLAEYIERVRRAA